MAETFVLGIDQGTSSSRAVVFDAALRPVAAAQRELTQHFPRPGWVEHDAEEIWSSTLDVARRALADSGVAPGALAAIGITNQRETTLVWDRETGRCPHRAIVWQDRRTADLCRKLEADGAGPTIAAKTGLVIDPYFSATKLAWILEHVPEARRLADDGRLAFGTVDAFLVWRLTGGRVHATDATNASRTMLFDIHAQRWDEELLALLGIPPSVLPEVRDSAGDFGTTGAALLGAAVPIAGVAGDQQAALVGQAGCSSGMTKATFGTGCFVITHTGNTAVASQHRLLTTVACRVHGRPTYAIEGSIFVAGSAVKWLRDELKLIASAGETQAIAAATGIVEHVHVVPAFTGLGAPWWDPDARGAILGLTRDTGIGEIVTATLQAIAYQTRDLLEAMIADGIAPAVLRVDGGMTANDWLLQFLADVLEVAVERPVNIESTVAGAAFLAGLARGVFASFESAADVWACDRRFEPHMAGARRAALYDAWCTAVSRVRSVR